MGPRVSQLKGSRSYDSRLFRAIERNDNKTAKYLVEKNIDTNRIENGLTPLNLALHRRNTDVVNLLLDRGCHMDINPDLVLAPPLVQIAKSGYVPYMELLLRYGCDPNQQTYDGISALHLAIQHKSYHTSNALIELLLAAGANVNIADEQGNTPLHICSDNSDININIVGTICKAPDCNVNCKNLKQKTPLQVAIERRNIAVAQFLIREARCDINSQNHFGMSPLVVAVQHNLQTVVSLLMQYNADISLVDFNNMSALHHACMKSGTPVKDLIERGADVNGQDLLGRTPLYIATKNRSLSVMDILLKNGADFSICDFERRSPLHAASMKTDCAAIQKLLDFGADVNVADRKGHTAVFHSLTDVSERFQSTCRCVQLLKDNGADMNIPDYSGKTLMHMAIKTDNMALVGQLLLDNINLDTVDEDGYAPMHLAVEEKGEPNFNLIKSLLQHNCDPVDIDTFITFYSNLCNKSVEELLQGDEWMITWYLTVSTNPKSLKVLCRRAIHNVLWDNAGPRPFHLKKNISQLPLPKMIQQYLFLSAV